MSDITNIDGALHVDTISHRLRCHNRFHIKDKSQTISQRVMRYLHHLHGSH
jgi:CRP-like cAMP-binding protein